MAHNDTSSPLAGILMTAFFGIISTVLGVVTMYQVHSLWVKYHHRHHHQGKGNRGELDIEHQNSSVCLPTTEEDSSICLPTITTTTDTEEWHPTPTPSTSFHPVVDQIYTIPPHNHLHHPHPLPPPPPAHEDGMSTRTTRCLAGDRDEEEGTCDLSMGVVSRFSSDSDSSDGEGEGELGEGEGIQAPPSTPTPESEVVDEKEGMVDEKREMADEKREMADEKREI